MSAVSDGAKFSDAVALANIPTLLAVLVQLTGDQRWLAEPYRPTRGRGLSDNDTGGISEELQDDVRTAALEAILAWREGRPAALPDPSPELLVRILTWIMGESVPDNYAPLIADELRAAESRAAQDIRIVAPPEDFRALIIGAGVSGLCMAATLGRAGIPYAIVERNEGVGGVWWENRYPGVAVDTPNHLYSFSFAPNDWSRYFAPGAEIRAYLERVADEFEIRPKIRFQTEVLAATWLDPEQKWAVKVRTPDGSQETLRANVVISAVGAFNKPRMPRLEGLDSFEGPVVHTARWPEHLELNGKRVGVIGNGASAMQLVPAIADEAASVTVFQHSPQWAAPFEKFKVEVPEPVRFLLREVPLYAGWYRLRQAWIFNDRIFESLHKDPEWKHPERSLNQVNDAHRRFFTRYIEEQLGEHAPELRDAVVPDYPPFGKRMLLDNRWFRALTRDDVQLVTERVAAVSSTCVVTEDGAAHEVDVLVLATGFDVVRFLSPMEVRGRSGRTLRETWDDDDARAYLGTVVPDYPNFFCLYGPNTQTGHGGSVMFIMEMQANYVLSLLEQMFEHDLGAVECRQDVHDRYNERVDEAHENMVWTHPGMDTYYRNARGRVVVNNPFRVIDYWHDTRRADLDDYLTEPARVAASAR